MKKAFTTIELIVAVSLLAVVMVISGMVFKIAIDAQRQAGAIAEITRNFRAITDQLNRDFQGLVKDGYLIIENKQVTGTVYLNEQEKRDNNFLTISPRIDGISFFSTGDFQSSSVSDRKSNISLINLIVRYYDPGMTPPANAYESDWILSRNQIMLTRGASGTPVDFNNISLAELKTDDANTTNGMKNWLTTEKNLIEPSDATENWKYFSGGVGDLKIEWAGNSSPIDANGINWQSGTVPATQSWMPNDITNWPKAIKFTMTLYDSSGVIKEGKTFTYIVYIGD